MKSTDELKQIVTQVRRDIVRMVHGAKSGHPGGSLGCADMVTTLYFSQMRPPLCLLLDAILSGNSV